MNTPEGKSWSVNGTEFTTNQGDRVVVVGNKGSLSVEVMFPDGHTQTVRASNLKEGKVRNLNRRSIHGVGFVGIGDYSTRSPNGGHTDSYKCFRGMITRAYSEQFKSRQATYSDCSVVEEWHNFQEFAKWHGDQENAGKEGFELDKDLIVFGNKIYSPETCSFVPKQINMILVDRAAMRGMYPQGVSYNNRVMKYSAEISIRGKRVKLGYFDSEDKAHEKYVFEKQAYVRSMAAEYKDSLDRRVYENLINFDWEKFCER